MRREVSSPSRSFCGPSSRLRRDTSTPRRERDAAASQPIKPLPTTTARLPSLARACSRSEFSMVRMTRTSGSSARGTGVGKIGLGGEKYDSSAAARFAVGAGDGEARRPAADYDDPVVLVHPLSSKRSNRYSGSTIVVVLV